MAYLSSCTVILYHNNLEYNLSTWFVFRTLRFVVTNNIQMGTFYHENIEELDFINLDTNDYVFLTTKLSEITKGIGSIIRLKTIPKVGLVTKACR